MIKLLNSEIHNKVLQNNLNKLIDAKKSERKIIIESMKNYINNILSDPIFEISDSDKLIETLKKPIQDK